MTNYQKWDNFVNEMSSDEEELEEVPAIGPGGRKRTFRLPKKQVRDMRERNQSDEERGLRKEMKKIEEQMKQHSTRLQDSVAEIHDRAPKATADPATKQPSPQRLPLTA